MIDQLTTIASDIRDTLTPELPSGDTSGSCLHASIMLALAIKQFTGLTAIVRGGGDGTHGMIGTDCRVHGHYWVEVTAPSHGRILCDITADQFGHAPVLVITESSSLFSLYLAGEQSVIDQAVSSMLGKTE